MTKTLSRMSVFKENKSEPVAEELVGLQPSPESCDSGVAVFNNIGGTNRESTKPFEPASERGRGPPHEPTLSQPSSQDESDSDDASSTKSSNSSLISDSDSSTVSCQENRAVLLWRKRWCKVLIILLAIGFGVLVVLGLVAARIVLEPCIYNNIIAGHSENEYTRTDLYTLLTTFKCSETVPCDVSEVRVRASNSEPNQVAINLTECNNVIYQDIVEEPDFDFTLEGADRPLTLIDENYVKQNYFAGPGYVTVSIEVRALYSEDNDFPTSIVYICQFSDPNLFKSFKSQSSGQREDLMDKAKCEHVTISEETNTSVSFTNTQPQLLFLGAVQTQEFYSISLKYSLRGKTIIGLNESSLTHSCSMRVDKDDPTLPSECSITVSDELVNSAAGTSLCVLGNGVSAGDGTYVYTRVSVDLIKDNVMNNRRLILTVFSSLAGAIFLISILVVVIVWKGMSRPSQAHSESESQPDRSMISATSGQTFKTKSRVL